MELLADLSPVWLFSAIARSQYHPGVADFVVVPDQITKQFIFVVRHQRHRTAACLSQARFKYLSEHSRR